ncbi:MAG: hypothetical protein ABR526_07415 [Chthoniobacterales bacterium]
MNTFVKLSVAVLLAVATRQPAQAIILYGTDNPVANTTAPGGALANSGWQFEGQWGAFLGTPIAPHFFVTAKHVGGSIGQIFLFQGVEYKTTAEFADPSTDLHIWQVAETFPSYAPLYDGVDEVGRQLVAIGRGTQRGAEVTFGGGSRGWSWGTADGVQRWGQNVVSQVVSGGPANEYLFASFDQPPGDRRSSAGGNEAHASAGDSGGGVFIKTNGFWKLAGIIYGIDGPFYTSPSGAGSFIAALFDARNFYYYDGANYVLISGASPVPTGFYSTRISSRMGWIRTVIGTP